MRQSSFAVLISKKGDKLMNNNYPNQSSSYSNINNGGYQQPYQYQNVNNASYQQPYQYQNINNSSIQQVKQAAYVKKKSKKKILGLVMLGLIVVSLSLIILLKVFNCNKDDLTDSQGRRSSSNDIKEEKYDDNDPYRSMYAKYINKADIYVKPGETLDLGTFTVKIDSFIETDKRDEKIDNSEFEAVYILTYTVENKCWMESDKTSDVLMVCLDGYKYIDSKKQAGINYELYPDVYEKQCFLKPGDKDTFQRVIAVRNKGDGCFFDTYDDGKGNIYYVAFQVNLSNTTN